ncbi:MAG TPA: efflux RND transporter periplasmic adaptor subunit [Vicinamibacterales bacterium]|nr:efflux RND transporter periplasmic adaptor subunit [Vicinamibacterales bacterium]
MRKALVVLLLAAAGSAGVWYYRSSSDAAAAPAAGGAGANAGAGGRAGGTPGRGAGAGRTPMTVELAPATRQEVVDYITVVGNLIGEATVDIVPRVAGRIDSMNVKLGDRVGKGQPVAKIEDREIREQINQAQATLDVNKANVAQRENDVQVQQLALDRAKTSLEKGLTARQNFEDAEARYNNSISQLNVAKAQQSQTQFRIDELRITLSNTTVVSPTGGFISRRMLDPGAFANANTVLLTVVDIDTVRLVANLVEKGFKKVVPGVEAKVQVDTFAGEDFTGRVSRVAPVFDPATRTAQMEIEVPNPGFRLKPGMYARVRLTVERKPNALTVPRNAVVDLEGKRGVFLVNEGVAKFIEVATGLTDGDRMEVLGGLQDGQRVITTGALALRDGDRVALPTGSGRGGRGGGKGGAGDGAGRSGGGEKPGDAQGRGK